MANVYLDDSTLQSIANAIRTQGGANTTLLPSEMPAAINNIGNPPTRAMMREMATDKYLRFWPGWDDASWFDIKYIVDEWNMDRRELPQDIKVGCMKMWPVGESNILFKLNSIVNKTLIFESTAAHTSTFLALDENLMNLFNNSKYQHCLSNDFMFVLTKDKFNLDVENISWTSTPIVCVTPGGDFIEAEETSEFYYIPMFAIGNDLGGAYNGREDAE